MAELSTLEKVKVLLGITGDDKDTELGILIEMCQMSIFNYLRIDDEEEQAEIIESGKIDNAVIEFTTIKYKTPETNVQSKTQGARSISYFQAKTAIPDRVLAILPPPRIKAGG